MNCEKIFLKPLPPLAKQWHDTLKPFAKDLFLESQFFEDHMLQPMMRGSIATEELSPEHLKKNTDKINDFIKRIQESTDPNVIASFGKMDVNRQNFMIDMPRENVYFVDFGPCTHPPEATPYLPTAVIFWLRDHAEKLAKFVPQGTGQNPVRLEVIGNPLP
jgi:hypothetical protein